MAQPSPLPRPSGQTVKFFVAGAAIALAVAYLVIVGLQSTTVYFLTVSELQQRQDLGGQTLRVSGNLVPGTFARDTAGTGVAFAIADRAAAQPLAVTYRGQVPDIVGDDVEIIAEGRLDAAGTFQATQVLAKCPSRLENAPPEEHQYGAATG